MDWIKKHADQFSLALLALVLLALSVLVFLRRRALPTDFPTPRNRRRTARNFHRWITAGLIAAEKELTAPTTWTPVAKAGSLFVSNHFSLRMETWNTRPREPLTGVPNIWLLKYGLNILSPTILDEDSDRDGFSNYDESGCGSQQCEWRCRLDRPTSKDSHPPYYTKLFLNRQHPIPFRLLFNAYDGRPEKGPGREIQLSNQHPRSSPANRVPEAW
jgi:hypothetical protein